MSKDAHRSWGRRAGAGGAAEDFFCTVTKNGKSKKVEAGLDSFKTTGIGSRFQFRIRTGPL